MKIAGQKLFQSNIHKRVLNEFLNSLEVFLHVSCEK